jgi:hypothetical protein
MVHVERRMYCFHASLPDSRPPPVSFSPPNAPPISAPLGPMLTLTMPQSEPRGPVHLKIAAWFLVNSDDDSPCGTALFFSIASSRFLNLIAYRIGAKISFCQWKA